MIDESAVAIVLDIEHYRLNSRDDFKKLFGAYLKAEQEDKLFEFVESLFTAIDPQLKKILSKNTISKKTYKQQACHKLLFMMNDPHTHEIDTLDNLVESLRFELATHRWHENTSSLFF